MRRALWTAGAAAAGAAVVRGARRRLDRERLRGRTVLVTGGSRGLGLELARRFGAEGCPVAVCARDERELASAADDLRDRGVPFLAHRADVTRADEVEAFVGAAEDRFGAVDVLVNNAGVIQSGPIETMAAADFREAMDVIFGGTVNATLAVLPRMRARGWGRVVNVTSIAGEVPVPHLLPYVSAKFAAVGFSQGLRAELAGTGVRVTTVVPGLMRTGSPVHARFKGRREAEYAWFALGDALPFTSISARRAARRIVRAAARGESYVVLSPQAKMLRLAHALLPGVSTGVLGLVGRLLPSAPEEDGTPPAEEDRGTRGMDLAHPLAPSFLTVLSRRAARRNNEYGGSASPSPEHAAQAGLDAEAGSEEPGG